VTVDYDGEQAAPEPASAVIARFLRKSFSVADVSKRAIRGWLFGVIGLALGLIFGIYSIWVTPPTYNVTIGLLPTDSANDIDAGGGGSTLNALAGLIGMGGGPVPKFNRFVVSLHSTSVAKIMDQKYDMVCRTYMGACNPKTRKWKKQTGFDAWTERVMSQIAHLPDPDMPRTAKDLANYTEANVFVTPDRITKVLTLSMESKDPKFATLYLQTLVQATNDYIRQEDRSTIQPYVDYLNQKLSTSLNVAQREALSNILLDQERRLMLSSVSVPYAASIQDGPNVDISNKARRMLAVDGFLGLVLGLGIGIFWNLRANRKQARSHTWTNS
jgi:hypothetical protein